MDRETLIEHGLNIVRAVWNGIPDAYKSRYRTSIWRQFEDAIRAASYTDNLGRFVTGLCAALGSQIPTTELPGVTRALAAGYDREVLRTIRDETTYLVLLIRAQKQTQRNEYKRRLETEWGEAHGWELDDEEGDDTNEDVAA